MEPLVVGAGVAGFLVLVLILIYNRLVGRKNQVENASGSVDAMLKKRFDLIPSLVATVKQYAAHENEVLTKLTELRSRAGQPRGPDENVALDRELTTALGRVLVIAESYPALQANQNFQQLQRALTEIEEQLSASRRTFNAAVTDYNDAVEMFPSNVIAGMIGYKRRQVFEIVEAERQRPDVAALFRG
jgi:LemA protein